MPIGFAADIRPLFRDSPDIDSMQGCGLDLSSYADVNARAAEIYEALANGSMPCDEAWTKERLEVFKQWMDESMNPGAPDAVSNPVLDRRRTPPPTQHNLAAISRDPAKSATHMSRQIRDPQVPRLPYQRRFRLATAYDTFNARGDPNGSTCTCKRTP